MLHQETKTCFCVLLGKKNKKEKVIGASNIYLKENAEIG